MPPRDDETRALPLDESPVLDRRFLGIAFPLTIATSVVLAIASTFVALGADHVLSTADTTPFPNRS